MRTVPRLLIILLAAVMSAAVAVPAHAAQRADVDFTAIVALSNCSGSVVRLPTAADDDPALVLTNGHCIEPTMPSPGQVIENQPSDRTFRLLSKDGQSELGTLTADRLVYASMTDTDVAVYRLTLSYAELRTKYDVDALALSDQHPVAGHDIDVVSGYWKQIYSCAIDGFVYRLEEGGYTWQDSLRYTPGCDTIGGTSGSPVIDTSSGEIVGVNNTAYEASGPDCSLDNPCEVDQGGDKTVVPDARYGQETYVLVDCLNPSGRTTLHRRACALPA